MHVSAGLFSGIDIEKTCPQISLKQEEKDKALYTQGNTFQCSGTKGTQDNKK
jgi:hypothetical protein